MPVMYAGELLEERINALIARNFVINFVLVMTHSAVLSPLFAKNAWRMIIYVTATLKTVSLAALFPATVAGSLLKIARSAENSRNDSAVTPFPKAMRHRTTLG